MDKATLYERIEAYLAGELPEGEREQFERQAAADPELAAELALHRRLERVLSDKDKLAFAQKSAEIAKEFSAPDARGARYFRGGILLLILLAVFLLWRFLQRERPGPEPAPPPPAGIEDTIAGEAPPVPQAPGVIKDSVPPAPPAPKKPAPNPFAPNPLLEKEITQPPNAYITIETAILESFPGATAGARQIRFTGRMLMAGEPPELLLVLSDNSLPDGKPILRLPVTITLIEETDGIRAFAAKKAYSLEAALDAALPGGLYYGRLFSDGGEASLWTGKLRIP